MFINAKSLKILQKKLQKERKIEQEEVEKKASNIINCYDLNYLNKEKHTKKPLLLQNQKFSNSRNMELKSNSKSSKQLKLNFKKAIGSNLNHTMQTNSSIFKNPENVTNKNYKTNNLNLNQEANKSICEKLFNKEFNSAIRECKINKLNINYVEFSRLLLYLNFLSQEYFNSEIENKLLKNLWIFLFSGNNFSSISNESDFSSENIKICNVENIRKVLFILYMRPWEENTNLDLNQKSKFGKRISMKIIQKKKEINIIDESPRKGLFDSNGALWLTKDDKKYIRSHFNLLCLNRLTQKNNNMNFKSSKEYSNDEEISHNSLLNRSRKSSPYLSRSKPGAYKNINLNLNFNLNKEKEKEKRPKENQNQKSKILFNNKSISGRKHSTNTNTNLKSNDSFKNESNSFMNSPKIKDVAEKIINDFSINSNSNCAKKSKNKNNNQARSQSILIKLKASKPKLIDKLKGKKLSYQNLGEVSRLSLPKKFNMNRESLRLEGEESLNSEQAILKADFKAQSNSILRLSSPKKVMLERSKDFVDFENAKLECIFYPKMYPNHIKNKNEMKRVYNQDNVKINCESFIKRMQKSHSLKQTSKDDILFSKHGVTTFNTSIERSGKSFKNCFQNYQKDSKSNVLLKSMQPFKKQKNNNVNFYFPNFLNNPNNSRVSNIPGIDKFSKEEIKINDHIN